MGSYKVFVIKSDMPDDSKTVGNDAKFEDITEMPIDAYCEAKRPDLRSKTVAFRF